MILSLYKKNYLIRRIVPADSKALAALHNASFFEGWDQQTFDDFLKDRHYFGYLACKKGSLGRLLGFILIRMVAKEAEIITLVVSATVRKQKIATALLEETMRHLYRERALSLYLEVEEKNIAAQGLYKKFSFQEIGRRAAYYKTEAGRQDALLMRHDFFYKHL